MYWIMLCCDFWSPGDAIEHIFQMLIYNWESKMVNCRSGKNDSPNCRTIMYSFIGCLLPALLPPSHIVISKYFWEEFSRQVNKEACTCSCWDTVFKGPYETGVGKYKHLYFNASGNMLKIWVMTVLSIIIFYEVIKHLISLWSNSQLRYSMLLLFSSAVFSHYYSWWIYTNYWNDDFYLQWNHQLYFTVTEIFSTWLVLNVANKKTLVTTRKALIIIDIAVIHTIASSADQFVNNVLRRSGKTHQIVRDIGLMFPDLLHIVLPAVEVFKNGNPFFRSGFSKDLMLSALIIIGGLLFYSCL